MNKPTCRLLNPTKPELGRISKKKLENIVKVVTSETRANLWKNTQAVITWFEGISNKSNAVFIQFDVCDFYPSIYETLLNKALDYASEFVDISDEDREIILQARKTYLFHQETPWTKKSAEFDVGMGSYDGAECCELVGLFMLSQMKHLNINVGLYRDDGLGTTYMAPQEVEKTKKEICKIFKKNSLNITIDVNHQAVNFLDVKLELNTGLVKPFTKPNDIPTYIHKSSNHPTRAPEV